MSVRGSVLDWLGTVKSVSGVFASLLVHDVLQRVAIRVSPELHQRAVSSMARWINHAATLTGSRFVVRGKENVAPHQNYIVVMNHQSLLDISMASDFLEELSPRYVSKVELARGIPGVSYNLKHGGSALIDRKQPGQAHAAIADIARRVRDERLSVVIFPEGTRSKTGAMKPFKPGGLHTLIAGAPGVPVLPVTSYGGSRIFKTGLAPVQRDVTLGFVIHAPMTPPDPSDEAAFATFVRDLEETIASALPPEDLRGEALGPHHAARAGASVAEMA